MMHGGGCLEDGWWYRCDFISTFKAREAMVGSEMADGKLGDVTWAGNGIISAN